MPSKNRNNRKNLPNKKIKKTTSSSKTGKIGKIKLTPNLQKIRKPINQSIDLQASTNEPIHILKRYIIAADAAQLGVWDWDVQKNILIWDDMMYKLYEIRKKDFPGAYDAWFNIIHPDDRIRMHLESQQALSGKKEYDTEFRIVLPDGTIKYIKGHGKVLKDKQGNPLKMIGINYDITKRKQTEEALREGEERYRNLFENSIEGIGLSRGNQIIDANKALLDIFGYADLEEFKKKPLLDYVAPESRRVIENKLAKAYLNEPDEKRFEYKIIRKDGEKRDLEISTDQIRIGADYFTQSTFRDITQRKRVEEVLSENEERFRATFENANIGTCIVSLDGHLLKVNKEMSKIFGYSCEELERMTINSIAHPDDLNLSLEFIEHALSEESNQGSFDKRYKHKDGHVIWGQVSSSLIHDSSGKPLYFISHVQDITERKVAEKALRESEEKFRTFAEQSPNMIFINKMGKIVYANAKCEEIMGYTKEEFYSPDFNFSKITAPEYVEILQEFFKRHLKGVEVPPYEYTVLTKQNKLIDVIITTKLIPYENEKAILGIITDITLRKRIEKYIEKTGDLRQKLLSKGTINEKLKRVTDSIVDAFNADFARIWLIKEADLCEKGCRHASVTEGPDVCRNRTRCLHLISSSGRYTNTDGNHKRIPFGCYKIGRIASGEEEKFITNDVTHDNRVHDREWAKSLGLVSFAGFKITSTDNSPIGVMALFRNREIEQYEEKYLEDIANITSQVILEGIADEALIESEEKFRKAFRSSPNIVGITALADGKYIDINENFTKLLEWQRDEIIGHTTKELGIYADYSKQNEIIAIVKQNGFIRNTVIGLRTKSGQLKTVEFSAELIEVDKQPCLLVQINDITERKRAEELLHENQETIRAIVETSSDWIWSINSQGIHTYSNPAVEKILGYRPEEIIGKSSLDLLYDEDKTFVQSMFPGWTVKRSGWSNLLLRWRHKNGTYRYLESNSVPILNSQNELIGFRGVDRDVTERKRAEEALKTAAKEWQTTFDSSFDAYCILNNEQQILQANTAMSNLFSISREEMIGKHCWEVVHGAKEPLKDCPVLRMRKSLRRESMELARNNKFFDITVDPILDETGKLTGAVHIIRDITERRQAEEKFKLLSLRNEAILESVPDIIMEVDNDKKYRWANRAGLEFFGEDVIGKEASFYFEGEQDTYNKVQPIFKGDQNIIYIESWQLRKDGEKRLLGWWCRVLKDDKDNITGALSTARDITEQKESEDKLKESEEHFRKFIENASVGACLVGLDSKFIDVNHAMCEFTGYSEDELRQFTFNDITHIDDRDAGSSYVRHLLSGELDKFSFEKRYIHKKGHPVWGSVSSSLIRDSKGKPKYFVTHVQDITERKHSEEALRENEERYRALIENQNDLISRYRPDCILTYVNDAYCQFYGKTHDELIGNSFLTMVAPEFREMVLKQTEEMLNNPKPIKGEFLNYNRDGKECWIQWIIQGITDKNGKVVELQAVGRDITEIKRAQELLRESEERFKRLVESVTDYIYSVKLESGLPITTFHAPACVTVTGYTSEEYAADPNLWYRMIYEDDKRIVRELSDKVLSKSDVQPLEHRIVHKNGTIRWVRNTPVLLHNERGVLIAYDGLITDITELKEAELERNSLQAELIQTQKMQSIGTLAGGIAHDFNNILGIILGYVTLLEKYRLDEKKFSEDISIIQQAVDRGSSVVQQILTFARKADIIFQPVKLIDVVQELFSMLKQTFPKVIKFDVNISEDLPYVRADRTQIHQALLNLCLNARDAMPNGGTITIRGETQPLERVRERFPKAEQNTYVCLTITDTGTGMDEATRIRIFDPFFTTKPIGKGTGMGLSVVYGIIHAHQGFIDVESEQERWTTFRIYLPVPTIDEHTIGHEQHVEEFDGSGTETILIVEDEEYLIELLQQLLESKGYKVYCAGDGLKAVELYKQHREEIALILTDMGLPELTGAKEFEKLLEINPDVKVAFASGYFAPDVKSELLKAGAKGFIPKPYEANDVLRIIRRILDKN